MQRLVDGLQSVLAENDRLEGEVERLGSLPILNVNPSEEVLEAEIVKLSKQVDELQLAMFMDGQLYVKAKAKAEALDRIVEAHKTLDWAGIDKAIQDYLDTQKLCEHFRRDVFPDGSSVCMNCEKPLEKFGEEKPTVEERLRGILKSHAITSAKDNLYYETYIRDIDFNEVIAEIASKLNLEEPHDYSPNPNQTR